jgi:glycosyltransferase involved in cell wall biosynthesis
MIVGDGPDRGGRIAGTGAVPGGGLAGEQHGAALNAYFQTADLFVLPGTGGLAVQQAMANALPVVVAQGDGTQDDLVRPENGWLVPADDLPALTAALHDALGHYLPAPDGENRLDCGGGINWNRWRRFCGRW